MPRKKDIAIAESIGARLKETFDQDRIEGLFWPTLVRDGQFQLIERKMCLTKLQEYKSNVGKLVRTFYMDGCIKVYESCNSHRVASCRHGLFLKRNSEFTSTFLNKSKIESILDGEEVSEALFALYRPIIICIASIVRDIFMDDVAKLRIPERVGQCEPTSLHTENEHSLFAISGGALARIAKVADRQGNSGNDLINFISIIKMTRHQKRQPELLGLSLRTRDWEGTHGLYIPQRVFLTWLRHLDNCIRESANPSAYQIYGKALVVVSRS